MPLSRLHGWASDVHHCLRRVQGNAISSTAGLDNLHQLTALDLRFNLVTSLEEVFRLGGAPC